MSRLRHPVRAIREPFGTAGLIVACVALVLALTGAAFAAGGLTGKQKKEVEKIAKKFQGTGPAGAAGPAGAPGANGQNGAPGAAGQSVTGAPILANGVCGKKTGVKYTLGATSTNVCSGADGQAGFPETLPSGKTETGAWAVGPIPAGTAALFVALSFNIPLAEAPEEIHFLLQGEGGTTDCPGSDEDPQAAPGHLCVYTAKEEEKAPDYFGPASVALTAGAQLLFVNLQAEDTAFGTWAVTAK